mgnify:CR=1 FL=1
MLWEILWGGVLALRDYVATHVLTCLVPAFLLAGGIVSFVNREVVLDYLGERAGKLKSFSLAGVSSFFLAACSCTVIPVSCGLYYGGAAIGAAFIILWVAPAANILALSYTGTLLGGGMVVARVVAALLVAFVVGWVMSAAFRKEKREEFTRSTPEKSGISGKIITRRELVLLFLVLLSLLLPNYLVRGGAYIYKVLVWGVLTLAVAFYARRVLSGERIREWLRETLFFVRMIFPLLLGGVFVVGVIGKILPATWVENWLGGNGVLASFLATLIGSISYFATMTEAPFVKELMRLGMGKGPALALLLTGPGLSLPNWLAIGRVFGFKKALVYVPTIMVLGTFVGWFFGNFIFGR